MSALVAPLAAVAAFVIAQIPGVSTPEAEPPRARIAYTADYRLHTIASDGSGRTALTPPDRFAHAPAFSPDGSLVAYTSSTSPDGADEDEGAHVRIVAADGSGDRPLTSPTRYAFDGEPSWSPDGRRLVFTRVEPESDDALVSSLVIVNADGTNERTIARLVARRSFTYIHAPDWSPTGARIVFTRAALDRRGRFRPSLRTIAPDGSGAAVIAADGTDGDWSPDGSRIAFASGRDRNGESCSSDECTFNGELYVSDASGANPRRLTSTTGNEANPAWSPDGRWIAFDSDRNARDRGRAELYAIRDDGSCMTWLTNGTARSERPDWQPATGATTDPGACGATERQPLIETDFGPLGAPRGFAAYWLGERHGNLLAAGAGGSRRTASAQYYDCATYEPAECAAPVHVETRDVCSQLTTFALRYVSGFARRRGVLVAWGGPEDGVHVFAGRSHVELIGDPGRERRPNRLLAVVRALRTAGESAPTGRELPRTALPARLLREVRRTRALHRRLGSVRAVHRRLRISQSAVRQRLRLARALRGLPRPPRSLRCR